MRNFSTLKICTGPCQSAAIQ